jgi:hypothetical protein
MEVADSGLRDEELVAPVDNARVRRRVAFLDSAPGPGLLSTDADAPASPSFCLQINGF